MQHVKIGKTFPLKTTILLVVLGIVIFILLAYVFGFGGVLLGVGRWLLFDAFIGGLMWLATPQVAVALAITGIIVGIYLYRRSAYKKRDALIPSTIGTVGTGYDTLSKSIFDEDSKVESA